MLITIVTCEITNGHNSMKLRNKLDHIIGNHVLEFRFRTIDRLGDIEKTLILSKLEFIPKIIRINKKKNISRFTVSSTEVPVQIPYSYVAPFLRWYQVK